MPNLPYVLIMLAAGIGVPVLAALNAQLGQRLGSPAAACAVLFVVGFVVAAAVTLITGPGALARLGSQPRYLFLGGTLVAFYILSVTYIAPAFGLGNAILCVLFGQILSAAAIDHFALFGAVARPLSLQRAAGLAVMGAGLVMALRA
ncbi:DMT family transporter [Mangrovicoccus algicola]|uniref:DMT family transporter n=1 Tax=Mangrovicoccus algicola TaxID=2771008 RepID=A0A8J6Z7W5_9RHOB|nr:DMT family transporter [Mangrovicoccus algicola]MBE3638075.1 DMT family transporter [Mangrovicoccus algicola]